MPRVTISFRESFPNSATLEKSRETFKSFTNRHRLLIIKKKTIGVALIDFTHFGNFSDYLKSIDGKNSAAYYSRKAKKREYKFTQIDRNEFKDDIHEINTSAEFRQGRKMTDSYFIKTDHHETLPGYLYFGVVNSSGKLVAYCNITNYGEFAAIPTLLGHKAHLNDGIMYYMLTEVARYLFEIKDSVNLRYLVYDTLIGASGGLQKFKRKLGFQAYRVKWKWDH
jgi:hypothetical protein